MTNRSQTNFRALIGAAGLVACAAITLPTAVSAETLPTRAIVYSDLDLTTPAGQQEFGYRLHRAVDAVCYTDSRELAMIAAANRCKATATADAWNKVRAKTVIASR